MTTMTGTEFGQKFIATVREIAAESPDFVYKKPEGVSRCTYVDVNKGERTPGCLLGQALLRMGVITLDFAEDESNLEGIVTVAEDLPAMSMSELRWLEEVQSNQDTGEPWGVAVRNADVEDDY